MKVAKIRDVETLERGTSKSTVIDFYCPKFDKSFIEKYIKLNGTAP